MCTLYVCQKRLKLLTTFKSIKAKVVNLHSISRFNLEILKWERCIYGRRRLLKGMNGSGIYATLRFRIWSICCRYFEFAPFVHLITQCKWQRSIVTYIPISSHKANNIWHETCAPPPLGQRSSQPIGRSPGSRPTGGKLKQRGHHPATKRRGKAGWPRGENTAEQVGGDDTIIDIIEKIFGMSI